jgi:AraC-like DNA-binding protein
VNLLQTTDKPIKEIAWLLGYRYSSNFNRAFQKRLGTTPGKLRRRQKKIRR